MRKPLKSFFEPGTAIFHTFRSNKTHMRLLSFFLVLLLSTGAFALPKAYFHYKIYFTPLQESYISTSLQFAGGSFKYVANEMGELYAQVEITQLFKLGDSIVVGDRYTLTSPMMKDSTVEDFYDVQRYFINPGVYDYELIVKDVISGEEISGTQSIIVGAFYPERIMFSGVEFVQDIRPTTEKNNFVKNGYFLLPYLTNYFPPEYDKLAFYTELYNTDKLLGAGEEFLLTFSISNYDNGRRVEDIFKFQKLPAQSVNPVIGYLPIATLPSGDYYLELNVIDKNSDTVQTELVYFQRRNEIEEHFVSLDNITIDRTFEAALNTDSIHFFLNSLMAISPRFEYESIRKLLKSDDTVALKKYFYAFWIETSPENPTKGWNDYKKQVYYAEGIFGTQIKHGFETDRGRIHLRYGSPNSIIDRPNEASAYPYQIWHYYRIGQRSNIKFVFYNPDLITNDYPMLHSELPGEIQNYRWEQDLHSRDNPRSNLDEPYRTDHYGGNSSLLFQNP